MRGILVGSTWRLLAVLLATLVLTAACGGGNDDDDDSDDGGGPAAEQPADDADNADDTADDADASDDDGGGMGDGGELKTLAELFLELLGEGGAAALPDDGQDLFHGDPTITPVRQDATVDIASWGVGRLDLSGPLGGTVVGPGGALACGTAEAGLTVVCAGQEPVPDEYVVVFATYRDNVPTADALNVRTYWVMFEDGDPANDFKALPQFANDVLGDSDRQYWLNWDGQAWSLIVTTGPVLGDAPSGAFAVITGPTVAVLIPASEAPQGAGESVGVSAYSGPLVNPYGTSATSDRAPGAQEPLLALTDAIIWTLP